MKIYLLTIFNWHIIVDQWNIIEFLNSLYVSNLHIDTLNLNIIFCIFKIFGLFFRIVNNITGIRNSKEVFIYQFNTL